ncbi:hypothetical protein EHEL_020740 [Encephalitozoon hellem ATCC 50504]|uniref:Uncharacterized protein n=1 Tax=Encephalitozoon hellem TaxID=27973 RepID=A0A9Q9F8T1_ENCHE|nr:uncharacterized protein EHEL_020740 [Encephalitozoon hellem ATCC 50504]AFM97830.1 hypothetical protein EHEL_020740 [Encephalitozoon hellem ATCC 50504]UTX42606.1 hypothetical protein GPU96_02g03180 [Encephalitozoon hellem]WEL38062.1 hypothetical protein PFJ87_02g01000 [Encephalitozoon hellem]|eukprot:XP_003886811.1 hypothetical protein EHEL_020740 [Encephalitozoon hellem ATCC 50504]
MGYFCQEILLLEDTIAGLLDSEGMEETTACKLKFLLEIKDRINERMMEMEEYYMKRIEFYRECDGARVRELEKDARSRDERYLGLLVRTKELKDKVEKLEIRDKLFKAKSGSGNEL